MKKIFIPTAFFALVSLVLAFACNKEKQVNYRVPTEVINIGEAHNAGLASILSKMQTISKTRADSVVFTRGEFDNLVLETTKELVDSYGLEKDMKAEIYAYFDEVIVERKFDNIELAYSELPPTLESFAGELDAIFTDNDEDLSSLSNRIAAVEVKAKATLTGQDLETVLSGCYVASYTLQYWHDNADQWVELSPQPITRASFSWKRFGRADLQGALAGAVEGVAITLLKAGPLGWKGWAVLVVGTALGSSAINAYDQLIPEQD